ncbi:MFS transporter [Arthrobacter sp. NPDC080031]|uniref:MFS transporter n=1 Tax=Arthrobacter sp. NPDC080031 TaxID=3155918 RepID=UPI0034501C2D
MMNTLTEHFALDGPAKWKYPISALVALMFGGATLVAMLGVATVPMTTELGWTLADFTNGASLSIFLAGLSALLVGWLVARFGPRIPGALFALAYGTCIMLMSTVNDNPLSWLLIAGFSGATAGANLVVVHSAVVTAWFTKTRGLALGLIAVGYALGQILMPPVAQALESNVGWRGMFLTAGTAFVVVPTVIYAVITKFPPGSAMQTRHPGARQDPVVAPEARLGASVHTRQFWLLVVGSILVSSSTVGMSTQVFPIAATRGFTPGEAAALLSCFAFSTLIVHLIVGPLMDRLYAPGIAAVLFALGAIGTGILFAMPDLPLAFLGAVLVGAALGAENDLLAYITSRYFPDAVYTKVVSLVISLATMGGAGGVFLVGQLYTASGGYTLPAIVLTVLVASSAMCFLAFGRYKYAFGSSVPVHSAAPNDPERLDGHASPSNKER